MFTIKTFCGGICLTNGYAVECPGGTVVVDAPEGMRDWLSENQLRPRALLLTHLHFDHVMDAAAIAHDFGCPVFAHSHLAPELHLADLFAQFTGSPITISPFEITTTLEGKAEINAGGIDFGVLHVPGHSPDGVCFYLPEQAILFAGDTLFESGIGRSDFPGGDASLLVEGIRQKILTLPDATDVHPGHGGATTVALEQATNPYLR